MNKLLACFSLLLCVGCTASFIDESDSDPPKDRPSSPVQNDAGTDAADAALEASTPDTKPECNSDEDCESLVCSNSECLAPTSTDGRKNGDESDVDCGGSGAPKCALDKNCNSHSDCTSDACNYKQKCVVLDSCINHFGGDTCGDREVDDPNAQHESCCTSIPIPSGARVDKYKVTAGRMRVFVERTNGDVKSWYLANRHTLQPQAVEQIDPFVDYLPNGMSGGLYTIDRQLGSHIYILDQPSKSHGCYIAGTGTHTYWMPENVNAIFGDVAHGFSQDVLDTKPIQCLTMPMAAAFCAWDGGRLQSFEENQTIFGTARFPWGDAPEPGGYRVLNGVWTLAGPADLRFGTVAPACPTCVDNLINWTNNYEYPPRNPAAPYDYSYWISAPGRFAMDKGPYGHMDVAGDLIEMTGTKTTYIDRQGRSPTYKWGLQGSWEGHEVHYNNYAFYFMVKYGKTGARCSR